MAPTFFPFCLFKAKHRNPKWSEKRSYVQLPPATPPPSFPPSPHLPRRKGPVHYSPSMAAVVFPPKLDYARRAEMRAFWSTAQCGGDDYCIVREREWCAELDEYRNVNVDMELGMGIGMDVVETVVSNVHNDDDDDDRRSDGMLGLFDYSPSSAHDNNAAIVPAFPYAYTPADEATYESGSRSPSLVSRCSSPTLPAIDHDAPTPLIAPPGGGGSRGAAGYGDGSRGGAVGGVAAAAASSGLRHFLNKGTKSPKSSDDEASRKRGGRRISWSWI